MFRSSSAFSFCFFMYVSYIVACGVSEDSIRRVLFTDVVACADYAVDEAEEYKVTKFYGHRSSDLSHNMAYGYYNFGRCFFRSRLIVGE